MRVLLFVFLILTVATLSVRADEVSESFLVHTYSDRAKVVSPVKHKPTVSVVIENKSLVRITGKMVRASGKVDRYVVVMPRRYESFDVKIAKGETIYFVPMTPPAQTLALKIGSKSYEIPARK